jgi:ABC-type nitrate/sulfonate/bicarbonate transport system permease component
MSATLKRLTPGILLAVSAALLAGLAIAVSRAAEFDMDFDLNWDDLPA